MIRGLEFYVFNVESVAVVFPNDIRRQQGCTFETQWLTYYLTDKKEDDSL